MYYALVLRRQEVGVNHILPSEEPVKTASNDMREAGVKEGE